MMSSSNKKNKKNQINIPNYYLQATSQRHEEANLTLLSEPKIFQVYKTYKILQHNRNILNKSAAMYIKSHFP